MLLKVGAGCSSHTNFVISTIIGNNDATVGIVCTKASFSHIFILQHCTSLMIYFEHTCQACISNKQCYVEGNIPFVAIALLATPSFAR
jgi:hypothetical protein